MKAYKLFRVLSNGQISPLFINTKIKIMKVNFLGKLPIDYSSYGKLSEFTKSEIEQLKDCGLDEVWYWYSEAPYEGSGQILMRMGELYDLHDAGHCSCYGPINRLKFNGQSLEDLATSVNPEYMFNECKELFELAGYIKS